MKDDFIADFDVGYSFTFRVDPAGVFVADSSVGSLGDLEEGQEVGPGGDIGRMVYQAVMVDRHRICVSCYNICVEGEEKFDCAETYATGGSWYASAVVREEAWLLSYTCNNDYLVL